MNKLKLFEHTYNKLAADKGFIAYYLDQMAINENKTPEEIMVLLDCTPESYYKLALCQAPVINSTDFITRIKKIAEYANVSDVILANIIAPATIIETTSVLPRKRSFLLQIKNIISLPQPLIQFPAKIYQIGISTVIIILFIVSFTPKKTEIKNLQSFIADYSGYTDSIKYTQLSDNTYVCKHNL
ncbi:MAG: hypothetical protein H0U95_09120 [Bacteroidetes bacterium]|nr:hypothetical protein [Bacteroidota bacterium]